MIWLPASGLIISEPCFKNVRLLLSFALLLSVVRTDAQPLAAPNAIPVFYTEIPPHLFATQFNLSAGTGRLTRDDKPLLSASGEVKVMYNLSGALYLSSGAGMTYLNSQERAPEGEESQRRDGWLGYLPAGIGFTMGDDYASFIMGIDALPGIYVHEEPKLEHQRQFAYGLGAEFGFLFRAGPRYAKGLLLGMVGKLQFMQLPDADDGGVPAYTYGGIGLVVRFY